MKQQRKKGRNQRLKSVIAWLTAASVVMGSTYFAFAEDESGLVYTCGITEEHEHSSACIGDKIICGLDEKLVYICGGTETIDNGDGTTTTNYLEKPEHKHTIDGGCFDMNCEKPEGHVHSVELGCYHETETETIQTCTLEVHSHGDSCYEAVQTLNCAVPEEHLDDTMHTDACYTTERGEQICTLEEHSHGADCYAEVPKLICEIEENHSHSRDNGCYTLICEVDEHKHDDDCTIADPDGGHKHEESCWARNVQICGMTEHKHTDDCISYVQTEAATAVISKIDALAQTPAEELRDAVKDARDAYDDLHEKQEQFITNLSKLEKFEDQLEDVDALINDIEALDDIEGLKDAMDDAKLEAEKAEREYQDMIAKNEAEDPDPYTEEDLNTAKEKADEKAADHATAVENYNAALTPEKLEKVKAAKDAYEDMRSVQQILVGTDAYDKLVAYAAAAKAEVPEDLTDEEKQKWEEDWGGVSQVDPQVEAVEDKIKELPDLEDVNDAEKALEKAKEVEDAYNALTEAQQNNVSNAAKLEDLIEDLEEIEDVNEDIEELLDTLPTKAEYDNAEDKSAYDAAIKAAKDEITAADKAYFKLSETQRDLIEDADELEFLYLKANPTDIRTITEGIATVPGATVKVFNYDRRINDTATYSAAAVGYNAFDGGWYPASSEEAATNTAKGRNVDGPGIHLEKHDSEAKYRGGAGGLNVPQMAETLNAEGYPQFYQVKQADVASGADTTEGKALHSLKHLFDGTFQEGTMENGGGLFQKDKDGYYYYDSSENAAYYNGDNFELYNCTVVPAYADYNGVHKGNFLPFNPVKGPDSNPNKYVTHNDVSDDDNYDTGIYQAYRLTDSNVTDNWYGVTVEFDFMMPKGGQLDGEDMIFDFSGDDDVWVYIDGVLVMDITGTHPATPGNINFATGEVVDKFQTTSLSEIYAAAGRSDLMTGEDGETFGDYTKHSFKFFYMERGGNISNCRIRFNMPTLPAHSLTVGKELVGEGASFLKNAQTYKFRVMKADEQGNVSANELFINPLTEFKYVEDGFETGEKGTVDAGGYLELKDGQFARFDNMNFEGSTEYYAVQELLPADYKDQFAQVVYKYGTVVGTVVTEGKTTEEEFFGITTGELGNDVAQVVTYTNEVNIENLSRLSITKDTAKDSGFDGTEAFKIKVMFGERADIPLDEDYTVTWTVEEDGVAVEKSEVRSVDNRNGIIELKAGETANFAVLSGTTYTITEPDATTDADGFSPAYTGKVTENGTTVDVAYETDKATGTVPLDSIVDVNVRNSSNEFSVEVPVVKTASEVEAGDDFTFWFDAVQVDEKGKEIADGTKLATSIGIVGPEKTIIDKIVDLLTPEDPASSAPLAEPEAPAEDPDPITVTETTEPGEGFVFTFDKSVPEGTYYYKITERAAEKDDPAGDKYAFDKTTYIVTIQIDQDADYRAQIVGLKVNGKAVAIDPEGNVSVAFQNDPPNKKKDKTSVTAVKTWKGLGEEDEHPDSVTVQLIANGAHYAKVTLSDDNNWSYTWEGVPENATWEVVEDAVSGYTTSMNKVGNTATITNTLEDDDPTDPEDPEDPEDPQDPTDPSDPKEPEDDGSVLGDEDATAPKEEEEDGVVAGVAETGDSNHMVAAGAAMAAALAGIVLLRKRKED